jgi:hypothetical protein
MMPLASSRKPSGLRGSFWRAFKKVFQWKVNILFEK